MQKHRYLAELRDGRLGSWAIDWRTIIIAFLVRVGVFSRGTVHDHGGSNWQESFTRIQKSRCSPVTSLQRFFIASYYPFLIYGVKELAAYGWHSVPVVSIILGIVLGIVFIKQQRKLRDPLLDVGLFKKPAFSIMR